MQLGDISVNYVELMSRAVLDHGFNPEETMQQFGITREFLATPKARISIPRFMRLGHALIQQFTLPELGLRMGSCITISHLGLTGHASMTSANLETALRLWIHYERLSSENKRGISRFYIEHGCGIAQFYSISPYNDFNYFVVDCILASWHQLAGWITESGSLIQEVQVEFPAPPYASEYQSFFQCPVKFEQPRNALIFKEEALTKPSHYAHTASHQDAVELCNRELSALLGAQPFEERVRQIVTPLLQKKEIQLEDIAGQLGLTPWSLQRRLNKEGLKFSEVVDNTRKSIAARYLTATDLSIGEIGFLLGYSSPAAFHRAFKRWFNSNPKPFRELHKNSEEK
ncbi:AraC family transcriptional regulator [Hahella ganghwensis]|uniref:AraC family transcriptional regulator n=1 Tax=Hahella ganghwensis TaxID=286420 RepID=UPI0003764063|nr:AraC family transcriptional regulator [Hahella ganghwensis]